MAKKKVLVIDEYKEIYEKTYTMRKPEYLNLLMTLSKKGKFPGPLLKILITSPIVDILNSKALKPLFKFIYIGMKNVYSFMKNVNACL